MTDSPKLIAVTTVSAPNRKVGNSWQPGKLYKPGQEIPTEGVEESVLRMWLEGGFARLAGEDPVARYDSIPEVRVGEDAEGRDLEAALVASGRDSELEAELDAIAGQQAEDGIEDQDPGRRAVEVNLDSGEVLDSHADLDDEDGEEADAQVS